MFPTLFLLALSAPVPKEEPVQAELITQRQAALLHDNRVQRELALIAEKRIALIDHFEAADEEFSSFMARLHPPSGPIRTKEQEVAIGKERLEFKDRWWKASQTVLAQTLTSAQYSRLKQLERRHLSVLAFLLPETAVELKLSPDQLKVIRSTIAEYREKYEEEYDSRKKPTSRSPFELARPYLKTLDGVLNEAQRSRWKELLGEELKHATTDSAKARETLNHAVRHAPEFIPK